MTVLTLPLAAVAVGSHDEEDPEYSILKQRVVAKMREEFMEPSERMNLVDMTKVAERAITSDLEKLIAKTVDTSKADYAVVTGV